MAKHKGMDTGYVENTQDLEYDDHGQRELPGGHSALPVCPSSGRRARSTDLKHRWALSPLLSVLPEESLCQGRWYALRALMIIAVEFPSRSILPNLMR